MSTINVVALARGGYSAYGRASYDARNDLVVMQAWDNEIATLTAQFPEAISTVNYDSSGVTTTTPTITSNRFTATLSDLNNGDQIRFDVLLSTGEMRQLYIAMQSPQTNIYAPSGDYGQFSP